MGQFGNQPDFATAAAVLTPGTTKLNSAIVYVGVEGDLNVVLAGEPITNTVLFKNVSGGFFPVVVDYVVSSLTTATNLIAIK